jgi:PEP-CTERM motif
MAVAGLALASSASAATVYTVSVWTGAPNGVDSSALAEAHFTPTGTPDVTFSYSGPIDWSDPTGATHSTSGDLFGSFINAADQAEISGWSSPSHAYTNEAGWLNSSMGIVGDAYVSYYQIVGTYTSDGPTNFTISHNDGASVYNGAGQLLYSVPEETVELTGAFVLPAATNGRFTIDYVDAGGAPAILNLDDPPAAVPEPSTWMMIIMGAGLVGAALRTRGRLVEGRVPG